MASLCKSQQCSIERRGFRQELDSWRHKLIHCVGFESILEGLFGPGLLKDLSLFEDCEPTSVCDWSFDENCLFCCVRREKVKEHLAGFHKPVCEAGQENLLKQEQAKIIRLERQAEEFINAVFYKKDSPRVFDPNIPLVAREIMQRMIRQFAAEYTSKTSSTQDSSHPNSTKNQSLPKSPSGKSSPPPATTQNPVLSKLLMADQDSPLDLTVKKSPSEEPCEQADGVLDLSTKKSPCSGSTSSSISQSTSNTIGNGICHTSKKATDGTKSKAVALKRFMVKLCTHHQEQFAHVLNNLCTEEQFTLSEINTPVSDDQSNGCTHHEGNAKASTAPRLHPVTTMAKTNCAFEIGHRGQLGDSGPRLFQKSLIPEEKSADNIMTLGNCAVLSRAACTKEDGKQSIKSDEETSLHLEDCALENPEKEVRMNDEKLQDSPQCTGAPKLEDQESLLDSHECDIKDPHESSSRGIVMSQPGYCLKESLFHTFVPFQEKDLVPTERNPFVQEIRQCLTSSTPSEGDSSKPPDAFSIDQPISECHAEVLIPKCESVPEIASVAHLEEIDLERKPSKLFLSSCPENIAHAVINGTSTCCPLSHAVNNTANSHSKVGIKASNGLGVENKVVFSPEDHVQEGTGVNPRLGVNYVNLLGSPKEPVSPSMDVDINLFIETKSMISVCDAATSEFHRDQNPLKMLPEKPLALEDPSVRVLSPAFLCSNGIDEQRFHLPVRLSDLKESSTLAHGETSTVVKNLETEDLKTTTLSSSGNLNPNDYPGGNSSELSLHRCTQALKPLHDKLTCIVTHSTDTCKELLVNCTNACTESSHVEIPVENKSYFSTLETDINSGSVTSDSLPPPQETLKSTEQFDYVISAFKENSNLEVEANLERSKKTGRDASSSEMEKLPCSTLVSLNPDVLGKNPVACSRSEEKTTLNSQVHDCSECIEIPNTRANARTRKRFQSLTPSDRRLRSRVFAVSPTSVPPVQAPKCIGAKDVNTIVRSPTISNLSADGGDNNVCKAPDDTKSAIEERDPHRPPNSMHTDNNPEVSDSLLIKKEKGLHDRTGHQEHKNDFTLSIEHRVPNILNSDISSNASILENPSNSDCETQNKRVSRNTKRQTQSKSITKPKRTASENYNLRTSTSNRKLVTKTGNCLKIAALKSEETFSNAESGGIVKETERPKLINWCCEEDDQERISNFGSKYVSVQKKWIPVEKEGTVPHKPKNRADKLKEIWKTKKRTRKVKSALEAPKYSSIQTLFMNSAKFSDVCQWFVETTETKSLVIVKKLNTRLPGDLTLPIFPLHKYPASSLYPHMLQAQRLKKYLKKFPSVVPARNDHELRTALAKLKESGGVDLPKNLDDIVQGTNSCRAGKAKGNVSKPVTDQILRKYNNCRRKSLLKSALVRPEKKEHMTNTVETKRSCSNLLTKMPLSRLASAVNTDSRSPGSPTVKRRHNGRKHFKDSSGKPDAAETKRRFSNPSTETSSSTSASEVDTKLHSPGSSTMEKGRQGRKRPRDSSGIVDTPKQKKRREASTCARNNLPTTSGNKKADSKSRAPKKQSEKRATSKTPQKSTSKKQPMNKSRSRTSQVVAKHELKTRRNKSVKQKQSSTTPVKPRTAKRVVRSQRVGPRRKSTPGPISCKKGVKHKRETRKPRSKTDCPTRTKRRSLESK